MQPTCWNCGAASPDGRTHCDACGAALDAERPVILRPAPNRLVRGIAWIALLALALLLLIALCWVRA